MPETKSVEQEAAAASARQIIRSTGIIGGSSVANVFIGLFRTKVAALVLGPAGIGLVGLSHSLISTVASFAAFGIGNVGTRQIAEAADERGRDAARRAVTIAAIALALAGSLMLFVLRDAAALYVFHSRNWALNVGWLAIGVGLVVGSSAQTGILTGMRRIGDLARSSVLSALIGTVVGIAGLLLWRSQALLFYVLVSPVTAFLVGAVFVAKLPKPKDGPMRASELVPHWKILGRLGVAFTIGALAVLAGQLAVRSLVQRRLGEVSLGQYQAVWMISMNYIGVILTSLATDYYPRLTASLRDPEDARATVEQQLEIALLLAGPILIATIGIGRWLIPLLYSSEFLPAVSVLRWQIVGDLFKIAAWPLGFILLAAGRGRAFVSSEAAASCVFVAATAALLPVAGIRAPAIAYVAMYTFNLTVVMGLAWHILRFRPTRFVVGLFLTLATALITTGLTASLSPLAGATLGIVLAAIASWVAVKRLHHALPQPLAALVGWLPGVRTGKNNR